MIYWLKNTQSRVEGISAAASYEEHSEVAVAQEKKTTV